MPPSISAAQSWRRATGRLRTAGHLVLGGGVSVALSAFLPWVDLFGVLSVSLPGTEQLIVLFFGAVSIFLGSRLLMDRAEVAVRIGLWVLALVDLMATVAFFYSLVHDQDVAVDPAIGFYAALLGLIATVSGAIVMLTVEPARN